MADTKEDELPGFVQRTLDLASDRENSEGDGPLAATLVWSNHSADPGAQNRPAVLYLHGFVDYFFQAHVASAFEDAGYRFFALDLRRYGRSLRPGNRPCFARKVDDYFPEIDWALRTVTAGSTAPCHILAHSTGGLIAAHYAARGAERERIGRLVLNSPFLRFPTSTAVLRAKLAVARALGRVLPGLPVHTGLDPAYGMTIHQSQEGEWNYDLDKKPLHGFPLYAGWTTMITDAQDQIARGLGLTLPILVLHSARSAVGGAEPTPESFRSDAVLFVEDTITLAPRLGTHVTREAVEGGLHDLTLSAPEVRQKVLERMIGFLRAS